MDERAAAVRAARLAEELEAQLGAVVERASFECGVLGHRECLRSRTIVLSIIAQAF
jgi:hypothetical protein